LASEHIMPKAFVTGAGGFVGTYLANYLCTIGYEVWGGSLSGKSSGKYQGIALDVRDGAEVKKILMQIRPDEIYHLAAISRPSNETINDYYEVNLFGTLNVLEAAKNINSRILVVTSAYVYGSHDLPISETTRLQPTNHYGVSKASADLAAFQYALDGLQLVRVRPFNHTGPGQSTDFLIPYLAQQIVTIEAGRNTSVIQVGNINSVRDFSNVHDVVETYVRLVQRAKSGEVYNLGSGKGYSVKEILELASALTNYPIRFEVAPTKQRPSDIPYLVADITRLKQIVNWQPKYTFEQTFKDMLQLERNRLGLNL
jgi:GDP-4-dehydro-6-deoxy-D-mannose reductase